MEYVILVLALPLFLVALALTFSRRRQGAGADAAPALLAPHSAPRWTSPLARRVLPWLVTLALFVGVYLLVSRYAWSANLVRLITLSRYGLLTGLLLVGLVPLGLQAAPGLLANLFVLRSALHLFQIAWMSVLVGTTAIVVCRVEEMNACAPYHTVPLCVPAQGREWVRLAALLVLCVPVLVACGRCSREAYVPAEQWRWAPWLLAGVLGVGFGLVLVVLAAAGQRVFLSPHVTAAELFPLQGLADSLWSWLGSPQITVFYPAADRLAEVLNLPGYTVPGEDGSPRIAPGHLQATVGIGMVLVVYVGQYLAVKALGIRALPAMQMPALFLLLLLFLLLGFFLQGAAFALDRVWIPAGLAVLLFAFAVYQLSRTDHLFSLGNTSGAGGVKIAPRTMGDVLTLEEVAAGWKGPAPRTLIAVTASGGGIQAAGWTARVLVGLHELYGEPFTRSIRLLSAVSGGSVGAMYALDSWPPTATADWRYPAGSLPDPHSVCGRAMASSLEATAWGFAFPDLMRVLAPLLVARTDDRGARIEEAWRSQLRHPETRMRSWSDLIRRGEMPIPIFNATVVETGQRFIASPVVVPPQQDLPPAIRPRQLFELYPDTDPLVSTMVRLSATFPYVSPICRPERAASAAWPITSAYHFADGGYVDNEGMMTVIDTLMALFDRAAGAALPFERVLLVRLMPFPSEQVAPASLDRGWFYATLGPIDAIENVRTASQQERNDLAVRLFTETAAARQVEVRSAELRYEVPGAGEPPLSWMLTGPQKLAIDQAWRAIAGSVGPQAPLAGIDAWFPRV